MEFYGISGMANMLMRSYLQNKYQRVSTKDIESNKVSSNGSSLNMEFYKALYWGFIVPYLHK
jgi:hypothetical protein